MIVMNLLVFAANAPFLILGLWVKFYDALRCRDNTPYKNKLFKSF